MSRCELAQRTYRETRNLADLSCAIILEKLVSVASFTIHSLSLLPSLDHRNEKSSSEGQKHDVLPEGGR